MKGVDKRFHPHKTELVFAAIVTLYDDRGIPPTIREIQRFTGMSSTSVVNYQLGILQGQGRIRRTPGIARSIRPAREAA